MWSIYNQLIAGIPETAKVQDIRRTSRWTLVASEWAIGSAMSFQKENGQSEKFVGTSLKKLASLILSDDLSEASLGLAAINSFYNQEKKIYNTFSEYSLFKEDALKQIHNMKQQKVGMVGHFPYIDRFPELRKFTTVFELAPRLGDLPAERAEDLLPKMETVFITASTLVNKTLPHLLELAQGAQVILVGASCPLSPHLFSAGIEQIGGTYYPLSLTELVEKKTEKQLPLSKLGIPVLAVKDGV
ncbi:Rossmann-like domain-containing protein [Enterococcus sp. HY326]|uniref:Rossmann-like domain-containing protein n=1 Tax=Enterococcus sp. HY326 TaxID=2971265 RepID=UPI002240D1F5|nr:DUF364 domain-containing protein [Enterococcus sp. HY326]